MNGNRHNLIWLILPSIAFFLLVAFFVIRLSHRSQVATQAPVVSPPPIVNPESTPDTNNGLSTLVQQITNWQAKDPYLAAPPFDRKIFLPAE